MHQQFIIIIIIITTIIIIIIIVTDSIQRLLVIEIICLPLLKVLY